MAEEASAPEQKAQPPSDGAGKGSEGTPPVPPTGQRGVTQEDLDRLRSTYDKRLASLAKERDELRRQLEEREERSGAGAEAAEDSEALRKKLEDANRKLLRLGQEARQLRLTNRKLELVQEFQAEGLTVDDLAEAEDEVAAEVMALRKVWEKRRQATAPPAAPPPQAPRPPEAPPAAPPAPPSTESGFSLLRRGVKELLQS